MCLLFCRICWFAIPFSLATALGLASTALMLPITSEEAGSGLVPAAVATEVMGHTGSILILVMVFMAIISTGSSEAIAVSTLLTYDVYRQYINPEANGADILFVSRVMIVVFGLTLSVFSITLSQIGLNLGWLYLFMGIVIGSAVIPLWNLLNWKKASGTGAVVAAWGGLALALLGWISAAKFQSGHINVVSLGTNEVMLLGNLTSILSSGFIHWMWSTYIDPQDYDFNDLDKNITLVEQDMSGLTSHEKDPKLLWKLEKWAFRRACILSIILVLVWPVMSIPVGVFSKTYFSFWVFLALTWSFGAALTLALLPLMESSEEIWGVISIIWENITGRKFFLNEDDEMENFETNSNTPSIQRAKKSHQNQSRKASDEIA
jgi:urea-proton symporter